MTYAIIANNQRVIAPLFASFEDAHKESGHIKGVTRIIETGEEAAARAMRYCELHGLDYSEAWLAC